MAEQKDFLDREGVKEYSSSMKEYLNNNVLDKIANKQDTLVNQQNIKSINGNSLLGNGDIEIKTHPEFPSSWTTNATIIDLFTDIENDHDATVGMTYLGEVTCSDLPFNGNAEIIITIMNDTGINYGNDGSKTILATLTSSNVAPYYWQYTYGAGNNSGWKSYIPSGSVTANDIDSQTATNGQVLTADGQGGASWQNAGVDTSNLWTLDTITQTLSGSKSFYNRTQNSYIAFASNSENGSPNDRNWITFSLGGSGNTQYPGISINRAVYANGFSWGLSTDNISIYLRAGSQTYRFTSGGTSATKYVATIDDIATKVPDAPTTDGTYVLKVVVLNGTPTYQWVLETI